MSFVTFLLNSVIISMFSNGDYLMNTPNYEKQNYPSCRLKLFVESLNTEGLNILPYNHNIISVCLCVCVSVYGLGYNLVPNRYLPPIQKLLIGPRNVYNYFRLEYLHPPSKNRSCKNFPPFKKNNYIFFLFRTKI